MSKPKEHFQAVVMEYVKSILETVDSINSKNINQVVSLMKANIRVLEDDVRKSFLKDSYSRDFNYRDIN